MRRESISNVKVSMVHDSVYEVKTLILLGLGFGLVGLDRWIVAPLFPHMMRELNLNFQQLGNLIGVLSITWGIWAIAMGPVSDRIGRKKKVKGIDNLEKKNPLD